MRCLGENRIKPGRDDKTEKPELNEISSHDLQQWIGSLVSPDGKGLERKTVNRKVSAIITYFLWLQGLVLLCQILSEHSSLNCSVVIHHTTA